MQKKNHGLFSLFFAFRKRSPFGTLFTTTLVFVHDANRNSGTTTLPHGVTSLQPLFLVLCCTSPVALDSLSSRDLEAMLKGTAERLRGPRRIRVKGQSSTVAASRAAASVPNEGRGESHSGGPTGGSGSASLVGRRRQEPMPSQRRLTDLFCRVMEKNPRPPRKLLSDEARDAGRRWTRTARLHHSRAITANITIRLRARSHALKTDARSRSQCLEMRKLVETRLLFASCSPLLSPFAGVLLKTRLRDSNPECDLLDYDLSPLGPRRCESLHYLCTAILVEPETFSKMVHSLLRECAHVTLIKIVPVATFFSHP